MTLSRIFPLGANTDIPLVGGGLKISMGYHGESANGSKSGMGLFWRGALWENAEEKRSLEQCRC